MAYEETKVSPVIIEANCEVRQGMAHLEHPSHSEPFDFAESVEGNLRQLFDQTAEGASNEWPSGRRDLSMNEYEREKSVVDERMYLCAKEKKRSARRR